MKSAFVAVVVLASCKGKAPPKDPPKVAKAVDAAIAADAAVANTMDVEGPPKPADACPAVEVALTKDALSVGRGTIPPTTTSLAKLEPELAALAKGCIGDLHVTVAGDVPYKDVIAAMDLAMKVGFKDIGLGDAGANSPKVAGPQPPPNGGSALSGAPIAIITKTSLTLGTSKIAIDADDLNPDELDAALKAAPHSAADPRMLIIQADRDTSGKVINKLLAAAKRAGFDNLLFAVKPKSP